jgi:hypothetical protein
MQTVLRSDLACVKGRCCDSYYGLMRRFRSCLLCLEEPHCLCEAALCQYTSRHEDDHFQMHVATSVVIIFVSVYSVLLTDDTLSRRHCSFAVVSTLTMSDTL